MDLLGQEINFLKSDLKKIQSTDINLEDFIEFQEKILFPNGDIFRYKYNKRNIEKGITDDYNEAAFIYISVNIGQKISKKDALEILENVFIRTKNVEMVNFKISSGKAN
jgi:hypothetical protein